MKEFIEKLIGRLDEREEMHNKKAQRFAKSMLPTIAIDELNLRDEAKEIKKIVNKIAEEYNNGWIPCSERLPKECESVLVCNADGKVYIRQISWISRGKTEIPYWSQNSTGIIAWQPLPAPYTENKVSEMPTGWKQNVMERFEKVE